MKITLLGTGAACPDADRSAPAFLVQHNDTPYLIDCGGGVSHHLMKVSVPPSTLETIFFTHIHIDHCVEFPSLVFGAYLTGKEGSFHLIGPEGVEHFATSIFDVTYNFAKPMMKRLRNKDISIVTKESKGGIVFDNGGLVVEALPVKHGFPTLAYKFTAEGKSVVFSGDTAPCDNIVQISQGADMLIIECSFPEHVGPKPGHCIPSQVGAIAKKANVKGVCLVHLFPNCKGHEEQMLVDVKKIYSGSVRTGNDLDVLQIG